MQPGSIAYSCEDSHEWELYDCHYPLTDSKISFDDPSNLLLIGSLANLFSWQDERRFCWMLPAAGVYFKPQAIKD